MSVALHSSVALLQSALNLTQCSATLHVVRIPFVAGLPIGVFPERSAETAVQMISTLDSSWEDRGDRSWDRGPSMLA